MIIPVLSNKMLFRWRSIMLFILLALLSLEVSFWRAYCNNSTSFMTSFDIKLMCTRLVSGDNKLSHIVISSDGECRDGSRKTRSIWTNNNKTVTRTSRVSDRNEFQTQQDEQHSHSNESDDQHTAAKKPYLVIHLGPPKTATTSLQLDLTRLKETLALDSYVYVGRYYYPKWNTVQQKTVLDRQETPVMNILRTMFKPSHCPQAKHDERLGECVTPFQEALEPFKNNNDSVLISDEGYTRALGRPEYYQALQDAMSDEWEIVIVMGYRRFFQWLPSDMFQRYRMDKIKGDQNWKNHWPSAGDGGSEGSPGEKVTLLFPWYYKRWKEMGHRYNDFVVSNVGNMFPLGILNLHHDQKSVLTQLVCDILPDAPRSCAESKKRDGLGNVTSTNDAAGVLHVNYDMLTTGAAELGLIDTSRFERKDIRSALKHFTESELGKTHWDFELKCPESHQLAEFLNMSLELETRILGASVAFAMESESRAAFWKDVKEHKFCEVDAAATLSNEPWKSFFAQFAMREQ